MTQPELAKRAKLAQSTIANIEGGRNKGSKHIVTIARVLRCRAQWLETGAHPIEATANVVESPPDQYPVPMIDFVSAGSGRTISDPTAPGAAHEIIWTDLKVSDGTFGLTIKGDSMEPEFSEGDKVIIDPAVQPRPGNYVVAKISGHDEVTFKKFRPRGLNEAGQDVFELVPLNEDYDTIRSDRVACQIVGTMVEHRRFRRR